MHAMHEYSTVLCMYILSVYTVRILAGVLSQCTVLKPFNVSKILLMFKIVNSILTFVPSIRSVCHQSLPSQVCWVIPQPQVSQKLPEMLVQSVPLSIVCKRWAALPVMKNTGGLQLMQVQAGSMGVEAAIQHW